MELIDFAMIVSFFLKNITFVLHKSIFTP